MTKSTLPPSISLRSVKLHGCAINSIKMFSVTSMTEYTGFIVYAIAYT